MLVFGISVTAVQYMCHVSINSIRQTCVITQPPIYEHTYITTLYIFNMTTKLQTYSQKIAEFYIRTSKGEQSQPRARPRVARTAPREHTWSMTTTTTLSSSPARGSRGVTDACTHCEETSLSDGRR